ncbi:MAG: hypothetical protein R3F11_15145 [Verrucomicrobiales bacterium]
MALPGAPPWHRILPRRLHPHHGGLRISTAPSAASKTSRTTPYQSAADFRIAKDELERRLASLRSELDRFLAYQYKLQKSPPLRQRLPELRNTHQPFHWFVEFYGIMNSGGFDVIVGNPSSYLEIREISMSQGFETLESRAIHGMCMERSMGLARNGFESMIVPMALTSTQRMRRRVQEMLEEGRCAWYGNFAWLPGKLFDTVNRALTIFIVGPTNEQKIYSTSYSKWGRKTEGAV